MFRRFFDIDIWKKPWFRKLPPEMKAAWNYITSVCDNVGVWDADTEVADFMIGAAVDWEELRRRCHDNIVIMDCGKWWLKDFCRFQHPDLDENSQSNAISSYVRLLKQHGLWEQYVDSSPTVQEESIGPSKEKEEVKEREKEEKKSDAREEKPKVKTQQYNGVTMSVDGFSRLCQRWPKETVLRYCETVRDYCRSHGKRYRDYEATVRNFIKRDNVPEIIKPKARASPPSCGIAGHVVEVAGNRAGCKECGKFWNYDAKTNSWILDGSARAKDGELRDMFRQGRRNIAIGATH